MTSNTLRGILLVVASMACFSIEDMFIKQLSVSLPTGQIMFLLGLGGSLVFGLMARRQGQSLVSNGALSRPVLFRTMAEAIGALAFITSLGLVPLSTVAAVFQATPLAITLGAALFLGEKVGWRRWAAIWVGFGGVLLIIRPGLSGFQPASLLVLASVIAIAARDLATRRVAAHVSSTVVSFYGFFALVIVGPLLLLVTDSPRAMDVAITAILICAMVFGVVGYYFIVAAMRMGDASAVTPFRYTRLIFSLILGVAVFGETPDAYTLIGATIIIATGLYTYIRERRLAAAHAPAPAH
jgi:drug/metabolite transporter (DMT)-like permease